jgi:16S rRNA G527 N7-methylase RsmG
MLQSNQSYKQANFFYQDMANDNQMIGSGVGFPGIGGGGD